MAIKILVVDDEPDVELIFLQKFRRRIRKGELEFLFAQDGRAALELLLTHTDVRLVFTDLKMPVMDGLALLKEIRNLGRESLVALVLSAYGDMDNIRSAMNQGAFDFLTKPIDLDDLDVVLEKAWGEVEKSIRSQETERKLVVSEQQREESEYLRQLQQEFFDNITHELRTPLTLLLGPVEEAIAQTDNQPMLRLLHQAKRNGGLILDLVNQLLDFASMEAGAMKIYPQPLDLRDTFDQLVEAFRPLAESKQIILGLVLPEHLPPISVDPKLIQRVLINLLSNAIKFTPDKGNVKVEMTNINGGLAFEVRDSGPGIPAEDRTKVFGRFFRSDQNQMYQGTGIGLSLTKAIIDLHGGDIVAQEAPEGGACFRVILPLAPPPPNIGHDHSISNQAPVLPEESPQTAIGSDAPEESPLIVLAEDNSEMREFIARTLEGKCRLLAGENGRIALDLVNSQLPDVIISDVMMPEMNGYQLCAQVKHQTTTSHIPVILLTAKAGTEAKVEGLEAGADVYLPKPFHPTELLAQVNNLLKHRENLRKRYKEEFLLRPQQSEELSMEEQFLAKVRDLIEAHVENERFDVETMADAMAMSRRTLTRKLKALTGLAPAQMIRKFRLEKALGMLKTKSATIREIALRTGFGSSSYFTNAFKSHFGKSPREYMETLHES